MSGEIWDGLADLVEDRTKKTQHAILKAGPGTPEKV
jgi:hypothetical protein